MNIDKLEVAVSVKYNGKELDTFEVSDQALDSIYEDAEQHINDAEEKEGIDLSKGLWTRRFKNIGVTKNE